MGPIRIVWYLQRYHGIRTSDATVYRVCKRHGLNRLPNRVGLIQPPKVERLKK